MSEQYVTYKYVLCIIREVFLQCFCSFCCIKILAAMAEKSQVKCHVFYIHWCLCIHDSLYHILCINMDVIFLCMSFGKFSYYTHAWLVDVACSFCLLLFLIIWQQATSYCKQDNVHVLELRLFDINICVSLN